MLDEASEIGRMSDAELVAYRNIILMGNKCVQITDDPGRLPRHLTLIEGCMRERSIAYEPGKLITQK